MSQTTLLAPPTIPKPEVAADIEKFTEMLDGYLAGRVPEDVFRVFRLNNGIYGQRQGGTS